MSLSSHLSEMAINAIWSMWRLWEKWAPFERGKYRLAAMLRSLVGLPVSMVSGVRMELFPASSADNWIISRMDSGTPVHAAMERYLRAGDVFIDVGANIGLFSIVAAAKYEAEVHAFDPSVRELHRLKRNARMNSVIIHTYPFALGREDSRGYIDLQEVGNHMMSKVKATGNPSDAPCEIRALNGVLQPDILRRVRLIKIDVEGYEMDVLLGMEQSLDLLSDAAFVIEISPQWLLDNGYSAGQLYDFMISHGRHPRGRVREEHQWDEIFEPIARAM